MSLRTRLLIVVAALVVCGLVVADVATYTSLRSFLIERVDRTVDTSSAVIARTLASEGYVEPDLVNLATSTPGVYVGLINRDLQVTWGPIGVRQGEQKPPEPKLPTGTSFATRGSANFTVKDKSGKTDFRAALAPLPTGQTLIVAAPLTEVHDTLNRLLLIEFLASLLVVSVMVVAGLWFVRLGLRPLRQIEETAGAIAAGDLSRRIENANEKTEVGRLSLALNAMLTQIEQAFEKQAESERRLRRFVGDASHELRTPLASVQAYAELFDRGARNHPEDLERVLAGIGREAKRMGILIDELLLLARLDQGRPLEAKEFDLTEIVAEAVEVSQTIAPDRPLTYFAPKKVTIIGDRERVRQVIDNLLANVRLHTPSGTPAAVTVEQIADKAVIEVVDEGPGLTAEQAAHVFERFYRGDPSRSRDHHLPSDVRGGGNGSSENGGKANTGTGLGLAIVDAIATAHGGSASVAATPRGGAMFRIVLPVGMIDAKAPQLAPA
jgi:two-component system OmpR family sensor kinase